MDSAVKPRILTLAALRDPSRYTLVPHVPMLDVHEHINDEKPEVDAKLLELIARNTNERIRNLAIPAGNAGHTCDPGHGCREEDQPETIAYVVNWEVDEFNGRPCLYADVYYKNSKLGKAKELPYRSVERYISDRPERNFIDAVSFQKSAPERDLGVLEFYGRSMEPGDTIVRYGRDMPAIRFPGGCGAKKGECDCGCSAKAGDKPKAGKKGEPKAATAEAQPKGGKRNKGHFKKGNEHHKRRRDRRLNEGVQVDLEHLKESILGLLKKSKTGTVKARYSLDDPTATRTTSTAGPGFSVHQAAKSTFGKIPGATVVGPKPAPQPSAPGKLIGDAKTVGANPGATPRPKPQQPAPNPTQAMPGQAQQQPQAPQTQPQQPQQPAARSGPLPGAASVTKAHDEAQRQAARGETPTAVSRGSAYPGATSRATAGNPGVRDALAPVSPKSPNRVAPPVVAKVPRQPVAQPAPAEPVANRREAAAAKLAAASAGSASATPIPMPNPRKERAKAKLGAAANPADSGRGPIPLTGSVRNPGPKGPLESGAVSPKLARSFKAATSPNVKPSSVSAPNGPPIPKRTVRAAGQSVAVKTGKAAPAGPKAPVANPISGELSKAKAAARAGDTAGINAFLEKHGGTPAGDSFKAWMMSSASKAPLPDPKLSPKSIGGKAGVFSPRPPSMPQPVAPNKVRKARIEAGDKLTSRKGGTFSVIGHTPDNGGDRFVHLKNDKTGKTIKVPRARFHAALQGGEITPPDEAFARTQPKPVEAKPAAPKSAPSKPPHEAAWDRYHSAVSMVRDKAKAEGRKSPNAKEQKRLDALYGIAAKRTEEFQKTFGKTIQVPRSRFHSALQRGDISLPDGTFAKTQDKPTAKPTSKPTGKPAAGEPNWQFWDEGPSGKAKAKQDFDAAQERRLEGGALLNAAATVGPEGQAWGSKTYKNPAAANPAQEPSPGDSPHAFADIPSAAERQDAETPPAPPMDRKQAREVAWKQQYNAARQFNGGKHLSPGQRKELENHFNQVFRQAEAQGLTNHVTPQPEPGSPFGTLPRHWHDPRLKLSVGNFLRDHGRSALAGAMTGLSGRMTPWSFEQSHNPSHQADPSPVLPRSVKIYRTLQSTVPKSGMVHQSSVSYATQALANEAHRNPGVRGMGPQAGIPQGPTPRANPQQAAQPNPAPANHPASQPAKLPVSPSRPELQHAGTKKFGQVIDALGSQGVTLTRDQYRDLDAKFPQLDAEIARRTQANGGQLTNADIAEAYKAVAGQQAQQQAPGTPQEPQQAAPAANPAQQPFSSPLAAKRLQAAMGMSQGAKADPAMASDPVVLAAVKAAHIEGREPTADDIARIHELRASTFRDTRKDPKPDDLAHAYLHGQQDQQYPAGQQAEPQPSPTEPAAEPSTQPEPVQVQPEPTVKPPDHPEAFTRRVDAPGSHVVPPGPSVRQPDPPRPQGPVMTRDEKKRHANDAVAALMQLGHKKHTAQHMVQAAIDEGSFRDLPELLKRAIGKPPHPPQLAPKPAAEQVAKMRRSIEAALRSRMRTA